MTGQAIVYETLARLGIPYEMMEHAPAFTVPDMERLPFPEDVQIAKNLFLRDAKGRRHFLLTARKDAVLDLHALERAIGCTRLSFASEERLAKHLGLTKGSVSPFGVLNDAEAKVEVVVDKGLALFPRIGVHPNDNAATLFLKLDDILRVVRDRGNPVFLVDFPA